MDKLKITVVSDTHYYSKKNGIDGEVFKGSFLHLLKGNENE